MLFLMSFFLRYLISGPSSTYCNIMCKIFHEKTQKPSEMKNRQKCQNIRNKNTLFNKKPCFAKCECTLTFDS